MQAQCIVAVYPSRAEAEGACRELRSAGIPDNHVRLSGSQAGGADSDMFTGTTGYQPSMWDWLFGSSVPDGDREIYQSRLMQGRTALSVLVDDAPSIAASTVEDILDRYDPLDLRVENEGAGMSAATLDSGSVDSDSGRRQERVIPLPEEELKVGKRATEQVRRVKTYVVEEPVEQDVTLHDERVTIERRPATTAAAGEPVEREYEIREHHEEPMVGKRMRAGEELVVRREADDRTEHVSDTIRKTKADIDKRP
jgi:uncharacterized protein (TIGR02271 family)